MYLIFLTFALCVSKSSEKLFSTNHVRTTTQAHSTSPPLAFRCYSCEESDLSKCTTTTLCQHDMYTEVCRATMRQTLDGNITYTLGCAQQTMCDEPPFGKRALTTTSTTKCCSWDSCNKSLFSTTTMSTQPPFEGQISCVLCRGPKFICERAYRQGRCFAEHQYCINDVENLPSGNRYVTRRCATKAECVQSWIVESSNRNECKNFNYTELSYSHFFCSFCCKGNNCNLETVPTSLYSP